jgi:hypothetical protein
MNAINRLALFLLLHAVFFSAAVWLYEAGQ